METLGLVGFVGLGSSRFCRFEDDITWIGGAGGGLIVNGWQYSTQVVSMVSRKYTPLQRSLWFLKYIQDKKYTPHQGSLWSLSSMTEFEMILIIIITGPHRLDWLVFLSIKNIQVNNRIFNYLGFICPNSVILLNQFNGSRTIVHTNLG